MAAPASCISFSRAGILLGGISHAHRCSDCPALSFLIPPGSPPSYLQGWRAVCCPQAVGHGEKQTVGAFLGFGGWRRRCLSGLNLSGETFRPSPHPSGGSPEIGPIHKETSCGHSALICFVVKPFMEIYLAPAEFSLGKNSITGGERQAGRQQKRAIKGEPGM